MKDSAEDASTFAVPQIARPAVAVFSGYDSAWTRTNRGAIASIVRNGDGLTLIPPVTAGFDTALEVLAGHGNHAPLHVVAIDQPLVVPNFAGRRPVEAAVSPVIGRLKGGMQPANRGRTGMFDDGAPIWPFLAALDADLDPFAAPGAVAGRFAIEVYPALATCGLFPPFYERGRQPKYNPAVGAFRIEDWRSLADGLGGLCDSLAIAGGGAWGRDAAKNAKPRKADQDCLDALTCAICGLLWWRDGLGRSVVVGDLLTGYIVAPAHPALAAELARDAARAGVPIVSELLTSGGAPQHQPGPHAAPTALG